MNQGPIINPVMMPSQQPVPPPAPSAPPPQPTKGNNKNNKNKATPDNPNDDRFKTDLAKLQETAAFGLNVMDVLKAQSGGKEDYTKEVQFSIRREFFTFKQVREISYWSMTLGMVIGALAVALTPPSVFPDLLNGPDGSMVIGVFLLSFGLSLVFSDFVAVQNIRKCTTDKWKATDQQVQQGKKTKGDYKVEPEYQGRDCFTDWDCTRKSTVTRGVCKLPKAKTPGSYVVRHFFAPLVLLAGILMTAFTFTQQDIRPNPKNLAQAIIYGIGFGTAVSLFFS